MWTNIVKFGTMSHGMCSPLGTPIRESAPLKAPKKAQNSENDYIKVFPLLIQKKVAMKQFFLNWLTSQELLGSVNLQSQKNWVLPGSRVVQKQPKNDQNGNVEKTMKKDKKYQQVLREIDDYHPIVQLL